MPRRHLAHHRGCRSLDGADERFKRTPSHAFKRARSAATLAYRRVHIGHERKVPKWHADDRRKRGEIHDTAPHIAPNRGQKTDWFGRFSRVPLCRASRPTKMAFRHPGRNGHALASGANDPEIRARTAAQPFLSAGAPFISPDRHRLPPSCSGRGNPLPTERARVATRFELNATTPTI